jgi:hypothetical protein
VSSNRKQKLRKTNSFPLERSPGIEPGPEAWQAPILPLNHDRLNYQTHSTTELHPLTYRPYKLLQVYL